MKKKKKLTEIKKKRLKEIKQTHVDTLISKNTKNTC